MSTLPSDQPQDTTFKRPVFIASFGFFLIFLAFNTTQALASSLSKSLANACFATLYGVFALVSMISPLLVNYLGPKWGMIIGAIPYCLMVFTYIKPMWATSLPAHLLVGASAPILWTSSAVFISRYAKYSSILSSLPMSETTNILNGVFFSMFHFTGVGLIIASTIMIIFGSKANTVMFILLGGLASAGVTVIFLFATSPPTPSELNKIEQDYNNDHQILSASDEKDLVTILNSDTSSINSLGENEYQITNNNKDDKITTPSLIDVIKLMIFDTKLTLMLPLILYNGLTLSFCFSDLSGAIIGKAVGTKVLGFIMASYYLWNTFFTMIWTKILTTRNRPIILCLFVLAHGLFLALLTFLPQSINFIENPDHTSSDKQIKIYDPIIWDYIKGLIYCFLFSIGDSILQQQNQSLLQTFFQSDSNKSDQSMSAMKLVQSAGICAMFVAGILTDVVQTKINILWGGLALAAISLAFVIIKYVPMTDGVIDDDEKNRKDEMYNIVKNVNQGDNFDEPLLQNEQYEQRDTV